MNAERGECLSSALTEANITKTWFTSNTENIFDRVGYVMPRKVVHTVVPKLGGVRVVVYRFLGILVSAIVAQPYIESELDESECI